MNEVSSCIFCKIINDLLPSSKIYEDEYSLVIKDIAPQAPIHYLIIPKKHVADIQSLQKEDAALAAHLLLVAKKISELDQATQDFRLVVNNGAGAGQIIFHLHFHFLGGMQLGREMI